MHKQFIILISLIISSLYASSQYRMSMTANYNLPQSTDFKTDFKKGWGGSGEIYYFFKESGFSASLLFGLNGYRGTPETEAALKDSNITVNEFSYKINYYNFPLFLSANYTLFYEKKFNIHIGLGFGAIFMEQKEKQVGTYTSSTRSSKFNEFAIHPSLGVSYEFMKDISFLIKGGYNMTLGEKQLQYIDINAGIIYKI